MLLNTVTQAWVYLIVAAVFEVLFAVSLKYTDGFTRLYPSLCTGVGVAGGLFFLSLAVRELPIGTAYAVWTGIGVMGTFLFGVLLFQESLTPVRTVSVLFILAGIIGLKWSGGWV